MRKLKPWRDSVLSLVILVGYFSCPGCAHGPDPVDMSPASPDTQDGSSEMTPEPESQPEGDTTDTQDSESLTEDTGGDTEEEATGDSEDGRVALSPCMPGMAWIPPGPFLYGPGKQEVDLAGYCIDLVEVTVGEINACIEAGGCDGFDTWDLCKVVDEEFSPNQCVPGRDDYPANYISWYRANTYCTWAGKRLPTSEEWEKSARGTDGRMFAWGTAPLTCELAHQGRSSVFDGCLDANDLPNRPVPNHLYPDGASPYGLLGTMGNLREWVEFREDETVMPEPGTLGLSRGAEYGLGEWAISVLAVDSLLSVDLASQGHGVRCASEPLR